MMISCNGSVMRLMPLMRIHKMPVIASRTGSGNDAIGKDSNQPLLASLARDTVADLKDHEYELVAECIQSLEGSTVRCEFLQQYLKLISRPLVGP